MVQLTQFPSSYLGSADNTQGTAGAKKITKVLLARKRTETSHWSAMGLIYYLMKMSDKQLQ